MLWAKRGNAEDRGRGRAREVARDTRKGLIGVVPGADTIGIAPESIPRMILGAIRSSPMRRRSSPYHRTPLSISPRSGHPNRLLKTQSCCTNKYVTARNIYLRGGKEWCIAARSGIWTTCSGRPINRGQKLFGLDELPGIIIRRCSDTHLATFTVINAKNSLFAFFFGPRQ